MQELGFSLLQLPKVLNPTTYKPILDTSMFLRQASTCVIELTSVSLNSTMKMLHSGYLRGAAKSLVIVTNTELPPAVGYDISGWYGPQVLELVQKEDSSEVSHPIN